MARRLVTPCAGKGAGGARGRADEAAWTEEDEVLCDRILSSIDRAHARPDARLEHDDDFVRAPKDGELFDLMQSVLLKVARPPSLHVVCVSCRRAL